MTVLVSCSKALLTHDLENPKPTISITPHKGTVNCAIWSHNNQVIASCGSDGRIVLSHAWKGTTLLSFDDENAKTMPINAVWFTSNSQYIASGGNDGILKIWDLKKKILESSHKYHFSSITSVHWNIDDSIIASSSLTGDIVLHNVKFGTQTGNFTQKGSQGIKMIKFSPFMPNYIASAGMDGSVYVWDINTRQPAATFLSNHASRVNAVTFSSFNPVLMCSAGLDQNVNFYDIRERKVVKTLHSDAPLTALGFHNDGHTIVTGTLYGGLYVYDLKSAGTVKTYLKGHENNEIKFVDFVRPEDSKAQNSILEDEKDRELRSSSSVNLSYDLSTKKPPVDNSPATRSLVLEPSPVADNMAMSRSSVGRGLTIQDQPKSILDPNNEIKPKALNIEDLKKQASILTEPKKVDKTLNDSRSSNMSMQGAQATSYQSAADVFKPPVSIADKFLASVQSGTKETGLADRVNVTLPSATKDNKPVDAMNIEFPNLKLLNKNIVGRLEEKSSSDMIKIDTSKDFTPAQKEFIKDCMKEQKEYFKECLFDFQNGISDNLANLHVEVIRQFEIQKNEIESKLDKYFTEFNSLFQRHEELRKDNERLKKTSY